MTADARRLPGRSATLLVLALLAAYAVLPFFASEFWLSVLDYAGIAAIGAIGMAAEGWSSRLAMNMPGTVYSWPLSCEK